MSAPRAAVLVLCAALACAALLSIVDSPGILAGSAPDPLPSAESPAAVSEGSSLTFDAASDAWIDMQYQSANHGFDPDLSIGLFKGVEHQALLSFDLSSLPADAVVDSASLALWQTGYEGDPCSIWPDLISGYWEEGKVTWNSQPAHAATADPAAQPDTSTGWKTWQVTGIAKAWRSGSNNYGILLRGDGKQTCNRSFAAREGKPPARLTINFYRPDPQGAVTLGGSGYVEITADRNLNPVAGLTIEGWVRRAALDPACQTIAAKNGDTGYWFGIQDDKLAFRMNGQALAGANPLSAAEWVHVAATHDAGTGAVNLYVNGILAAKGSIKGYVPFNADPLQLGSDRGKCNFKGSLSDIRLWDRPFGVPELRERMGNDVDPREQGLLGAWSLAGGAGDLSGRYESVPVGTIAFGPLGPGVATAGQALLVPRIDGVFALDGLCSSGEYGSLRVPIWYDNGHILPNPVYAYIGAVGDQSTGYLAVCMDHIDATAGRAALYIDPDNSAGALAGPTDYVVRALPGRRRHAQHLELGRRCGQLHRPRYRAPEPPVIRSAISTRAPSSGSARRSPLRRCHLPPGALPRGGGTRAGCLWLPGHLPAKIAEYLGAVPHRRRAAPAARRSGAGGPRRAFAGRNRASRHRSARHRQRLR